jgi:arylsulfatase A-like enzyme/Tfp pilus assembly protein PilF
LLLASVAISGCSREPASTPLARHNIVLITIDTLRADRVGRGLTPTLDRLAQSGISFANARTTVPLTLPAHVSLMTGTTPPVHGVRENGTPFGGGIPTIARVLRNAGYRTAAFVGAYVLDDRFGLADGFETYDDRVPRDPKAAERLEAERRAADVIDAATAWLQQTSTSSSPFFLWVHVYDPHAPYDPPPAFRPQSGSLYDGEVQYADAQIARLLERISIERTVVVAAGDHGEGLGEHGEQTHGILAYDSTLRVPLIVHAPDQQPRQIDNPVSLADVAPSLLRFVGIQDSLAPEPTRRDLFGTTDTRTHVYAETQYPRAAGWHPLTALAGQQWKLISSSEKELYDLSSDPHETRNVAAQHATIVEGMASIAGKIAAAPTAASSPAAVSADAAAKLRALGYVAGSTTSAAGDASAPNPSAEVAFWTLFERALGLMNAGRWADAMPALAQLANRYPAGMVFQTSYARALQESGRPKEAVTLLRAAVGRRPNDAALFHELAVAARAAGDLKEALRAEQAALALGENNPAALNGLGLLYADAGRPAEAATAFERAAKADASNASYWSNLGNARRDLKDGAGAEAAYRRALEADPEHADAANGLGVLLVQIGKPSDAIAWFEKALKASPDFHEARLNLGIAYQESGQREKAAAVYREVLSKTPERFVRERRAANELLKTVK